MADRYWVGGSGNINDTSHWSTASGGSSGASVPTQYDNAIWDTASYNANYTVTMNVGLTCLSLTANHPTGGTMSFTGYGNWTPYGNIYFASGITIGGGGWYWYGTGTRTATFNGVQVKSTFAMRGSGEHKLMDTYTGGLGIQGDINLEGGTFNANGQTVDLSRVYLAQFGGNLTFYNLKLGGLYTSQTIVRFYNNITVTGTLTMAGYSNTARLFITGHASEWVAYSQKTITSATNDVSGGYINIQGINGQGAASWNLSGITGGSGNCGGNSNITFTSPIDIYWKSSGSYKYVHSSTDCFFLATNGGGGSARIPLPQDTLIFDSNSIPSTGYTVVFGGSQMSNVVSTNVTNTPSFYFYEASIFCGSITLGTVSATGTGIQFYNPSGVTLNTNGVTVPLLKNYGTLTLGSNVTITGRLENWSGTFNANGYNVTCAYLDFANGGASTVINMGSGLWTVTSHNSGTCLTIGGSCSINGSTSTIKFTDNSATNKKIAFNYVATRTFGNIWIATLGTGTFTFDNAFTCTDLKIDGGRTVIFTNSTTTTMTTFSPQGSAGNLVTLRNSSSTTKATIAKAGGGKIDVNYMDINYIIGSPSNTWYVGSNSVDGGSNTNIYFTSAPTFSPKWTSMFEVFDR